MAVDEEGKKPFLSDKVLKFLSVRIHDFDRDSVVRTDGLDESKCLRMKASRIEAEDRKGKIRFDRHLDEGNIFSAAEGNGTCIAKMLKGRLYNRLRRCSVKLNSELIDIRADLAFLRF